VAPPGPTLGGRLHAALRELSPGYFAAVMATGVVSVGLGDDDRWLLSRILLVLTVAAFAALVVLNGWRLLSHRAELVDDFTHPLRGFGFYTFVAAADVLAARIADAHTGVALGLLVIAASCWLLRGCAVPRRPGSGPASARSWPRPTGPGSCGRSAGSRWPSRRPCWPAYATARPCRRWR